MSSPVARINPLGTYAPLIWVVEVNLSRPDWLPCALRTRSAALCNLDTSEGVPRAAKSSTVNRVSLARNAFFSIALPVELQFSGRRDGLLQRRFGAV